MAQQTQSPSGQKKSSGATPTVNSAISGFLGGVRSFFAPTPPATGGAKSGATTTTRGSSATDTRPTINWRKMLLGILLLFFGINAIQLLLFFLDNQVFKGKLQTTVLVTIPLFGPLSIYSALVLAALIGLYVLLIRFDFLPRANRAQAQASAAGANNRARTTSTKKPAAIEKSATTARQAISGPHDDEYEQARMAQRARRRRDARK